MTAPPAAATTASASRAGRCRGTSGRPTKWSVTTGLSQRRPRSARTSPQGTKIGGCAKRKSHIIESSSPIVLDTRLMQPL